MLLARARNLGVLTLGVLLAASLTAGSAQAGASAGPSPMMLPAYAHGTITGAGPHSGVRLVLIAWPKPSVMAKVRVRQHAHTRVIGRATSSSTGTYSIHPSVQLKKGLVNLEVIGRSSKAAGTYSFGAMIHGKTITPAAAGSHASTGPVAANIHMMALPKSEQSVMQPAGFACDGTPLKVSELGQKQVDVGGLYSLMPNGKVQETYATGSETTIGVAATVESDFGGYSQEGTFTLTTSSSQPFKAQVGRIVNQQTSYSFGKYRMCLITQVLPEVWATGEHVVAVKPPPLGKNTCGEHIHGGGIFTRSSGKAGTFKAGVDLKKDGLGISVSTQSGYNKNVSITYTFPSGGGFMCGNNALPTISAFDEMSPLGNPSSRAGGTSRSK